MLKPRAVRPVASAFARGPWTCPSCLSSRQFAKHPNLLRTVPIRRNQTDSKSKPSKPKGRQPTPAEAPDHRKIGTQQGLFTTSIYSPGSPIFLPAGATIFNRLVDFLRKQYVNFGFQEVITPTIYKKSLWAKSGHLENYKDDMYSVTGYATPETRTGTSCCGENHGKDAAVVAEADGEEGDDGEYGLKPMNCPGHCIIFASQKHSYRDLPVRYADFSPLHRNEVSGALSGLTRVRRFHQDDGHIFCRPMQVEEEIKKTLDFVKVVYTVLRMDHGYRLALSTRPAEFIGEVEEWDRAEDALRRALDSSGMEWSVNEGDGAFYGPKIDIVLTDSDGKEHQTATIQLDFQLPKRFDLEYQAPAPEYEARGEICEDPELLAEFGPVRPVMIHRAVLGSVERLMAILIENTNGKWPFWLNPRQVAILTINEKEEVVQWAEHVRRVITGTDTKVNDYLRDQKLPPASEAFQPTGITVDIDSTGTPLGKKIKLAKAQGYGKLLVIGDKDVEQGGVTLDGENNSPEDVRKTLVTLLGVFE